MQFNEWQDDEGFAGTARPLLDALRDTMDITG
jgi:hypothetical protein